LRTHTLQRFGQRVRASVGVCFQAEGLIRMKMRVGQAGRQQMAARIDCFTHPGVDRCTLNRGDPAVSQDDVGFGAIGQPAAAQQ